MSTQRELVFIVTQEADGGFCAESLGENIFTQGDTWEELRDNVKDATRGYFFDSPMPTMLRLRLQREETLAVA